MKTRLVLSDLKLGQRILTGDKAHYLRDVLRVRVGQTIALFDGHGQSARGIVEGVGKAQVVLRAEDLQEVEPAPAAVDLTIGLALPKGGRADWVVEKLTELSVNRIVWLVCERSVSVPRRDGARHERWLRLAEAAAMQCGRLTLPSIEGPEPWSAFVSRRADRRYVADLSCETGAAPALVAPAEALLAIGPEGGLTEEELQIARAAGFLSVRLSEQTLRVETAALVGAAVLLAPRP